MQTEDSRIGVMNSLTYSTESLAAHEFQHFDNILKLIEKCNGEQDIDKKIQLLKFINSSS
jgi:tRNA isopentenyl-2-thiomethyl-A-37 hydroxylase MiaE